MRTLIFLCLLPAMIFAQQYYQASGQTQVFTLTAGAKAGPTTVRHVTNSALTTAPHLAMTTADGIRLSIAGVIGHARVTIYNLSGKVLQVAETNGCESIALRANLSNGVYFARLEVNGRLVQTTRFWKAR